MEAGEAFEMREFLSQEAQGEIGAAFAKYGFTNLTGAFELLGGRYTYDQLRIYRALVSGARA